MRNDTRLHFNKLMEQIAATVARRDVPVQVRAIGNVQAFASVTVKSQVDGQVVRVHFTGMIENVLGPKALDPQWYAPVTLSTATFLVYWLFLLWLYRQKIFLRI